MSPPSLREPRGSNTSVKRKVTLYFHSAMLAETQREGIRQDRSISWIIQAAWRLAREEVRKLPTASREDDEIFARDSAPPSDGAR